MKNKIFFTIIFAVLFSGLFSPNAIESAGLNPLSAQVFSCNQVFAEETSANSNTTSVSENNDKKNVEKKHIEGTKPNKGFGFIIKKFLFTMFLVGVSALVIFLALVGYKKFKGGSNLKIIHDDSKSLSSPTNFKDTINFFLDKTRD